jgi:hypothetical protein
LERAIEARGWSLERASRRLRTNKPKLFRVIRGQEPDLRLAVAIEETLGIEVRRWLLVILTYLAATGGIDIPEGLDLFLGSLC